MPAGAPTTATRELRIAPVMTGGTSLAVWMGGATLELYTVLSTPPAWWVRSASSRHGADPSLTQDVYGSLLGLTETTPVIDVVTGTSAGGLNGTLLAAAVGWGVPLSSFEDLRETWMDAADIEKLLRRLTESDPPSLLNGDGSFIPPLLRRLQAWERHKGPLGAVDLVTTFTAVSSVPRRLVDDFGERMDEVTHAGVLRFLTTDFADPSAQLPDKLAIASRISASIPGVFETSFLPTTAEDASASSRPDFHHHVRIGTQGDAGWVVDGGLVVNLPLTEALDRVFDQPAVGPVRRVFLYVSPTPSTPETKPASPTARPSLTSTLLTVINAPRAESVAADLRTIADHNAAVKRQRSARIFMSRVVGTQGDAEHPRADRAGHETGADRLMADLMPEFVRRRADQSVASTLAQLEREVPLPTSVDRHQLRTTLVQVRMSEKYLPHRPVSSAATDAELGISPWAWGISPLEQAVSFAIGVIGRTLTLPIPRTRPGATSAVLSAREELSKAKARVHEVRDRARTIRTGDSEYWRRRLADLLPAARRAGHAAPTFDDVYLWAFVSYEGWRLVQPDTTADVTVADPAATRRSQDEIRRQMDDLATALIGADAHLRTVLSAAGADTHRRGASRREVDSPDEPARRQAIRQDAQDIWCEYSGIVVPGDAQRTLRGLLRMHVYQVVALGDVLNLEQPAEVMQLSWNASDHLTDRDPAAKLCGTEAARLGAFIKPSWRANDFFWGRMDASARLVQLLLEPARLVYLHRSAADVRRALLLEAAHLTEDEDRRVTDELAFLDEDRLPVPTTLPACVTVLAARRQAQIARSELGNIADAIAESTAGGGHESPAEARFRRELAGVDLADAHLDEVTRVLKAMTVGDETMTTEQYSRMLVRSGTRAASLGATMLTGDSLGLPVVGKALRWLRLPLKGMAAVAALVAGSSTPMVALGTLLAGTSGAIVAMALLGVALPGPLVATGWIVSIGLVVWAMLRHGVLALVTPLVVAAVVALALVGGPGLREILYTDTPPTERTTLNGADAIRLSGDAVARITTTRDGHDVVTDVPLSEGRIEVSDTGGRAVLETTGLPGSAASWKAAGFVGGPHAPPLGPWAGVVLAVLALLSALRAWRIGISAKREADRRTERLAARMARRRLANPHGVPPTPPARKDRERTPGAWVLPAAWAAIAVVLAAAAATVRWWGEALLVGSPASAPSWKPALVDAASWLHGQRFWVVALLLIALASVLGVLGDRAHRLLAR